MSCPPTPWIVLAAACGLLGMAIQSCLVIPAVRATAPTGTRLLSLAFGKDEASQHWQC